MSKMPSCTFYKTYPNPHTDVLISILNMSIIIITHTNNTLHNTFSYLSYFGKLAWWHPKCTRQALLNLITFCTVNFRKYDMNSSVLSLSFFFYFKHISLSSYSFPDCILFRICFLDISLTCTHLYITFFTCLRKQTFRAPCCYFNMYYILCVDQKCHFFYPISIM